MIERVDPRDTEWEMDRPVYRVYFWHQPPAPPGVQQSQMGYHSEEHRVSGAEDVHEVLTWAAQAARPEQTFTLYVEQLRDGSPGLIRLSGIDPTEGD
jgi:hypothetical protein